VALVASSFHPHSGGVEEHVSQVARELRSQGIPVVVWTVDRGEHLGTQVVDGVEVRYLPTPLPSRSFRGVLHFLAALPAALVSWWRAGRSFRPTILHIHCFGPNGLYATLFARLLGLPLVLTSHGETFADDHAVFDRSALQRSALRSALTRAACVTACSQVVLDDLERRFGNRGGVVVPNGVEPAGATPEGQLSDPAVVLAVGRLERMKGFDLLIEAVARAQLPPGARLVIGGEGSEAGALRRQSRELGVEDRVSFPGRLSRLEVSDLMNRAAVVVVPSRREAFGIVVLEAWRSGTPLVVTSRGGPADLVTDGIDGLVVDPEDADALAGRLGRVLGDPGLARRLGDRGRLRVAEFTWQRTVSAYLEVYDASSVPARI
jgi:glycosyltransferase involved in cell wall biosynthesis